MMIDGIPVSGPSIFAKKDIIAWKLNIWMMIAAQTGRLFTELRIFFYLFFWGGAWKILRQNVVKRVVDTVQSRLHRKQMDACTTVDGRNTAPGDTYCRWFIAL